MVVWSLSTCNICVNFIISVCFLQLCYFFKNHNIDRIQVVFNRYNDLIIKYIQSLFTSDDVNISEIVTQNADTKVSSDIKCLMTCKKI